MANGMDQTMSRREFIARRFGDVGLVALVVAAGPIFGRMLNSLYVQDDLRRRVQSQKTQSASPVRHDGSQRIASSEGTDR